MPGTPPATTPVTSPKRLLHFGHPRAGRRGNNSQQSIPVIHEKWRRSREMLAPGMGDLERCKRQDKKSKSRLLRIRQVILCLQLISSYVPRLTPRPLWACPTLCLLVLRRLKLPIRLLVVALLAQSLVIFQATEGSFLNGATRVWPEGIEVFSTVMVLSFHAVLMVFAIGKSVCFPGLLTLPSLTHSILHKDRGRKGPALYNFHCFRIEHPYAPELHRLP